MEGVHRCGVPLEKTVVVAVQLFGEHRVAVAALHKNLLHAGLFQGVDHLVEDGAEVGLAGQGVLRILKQGRIGLPRGDGGAPAVHQIGEQLLGLCPAKAQRLPMHIDVKAPKGFHPHPGAGFPLLVEEGQLPQDGFLGGGLQQVAAGMHGKGVHRVLGKAGDKDDVDAGLEPLQFQGQLQAAHAPCLDVQEGHVYGV